MGHETRWAWIPDWLRGLVEDEPEPESEPEPDPEPNDEVHVAKPLPRRVRRQMRAWAGRSQRRQRRSKRKRAEALRREMNATYRQLAGGNATVARALRITQGILPDGWGELCRLTKWGKNHHVDESGERTFCGLDATDARPVHWGRGWCVQCDDVASAMEERNAIESRKETGI